jgi:hypothetical protein
MQRLYVARPEKREELFNFFIIIANILQCAAQYEVGVKSLGPGS